ncbi:MAG TPA: hypothetical protein VIK51_20700 [Vicinamibacteria bacterium]|jgi:hypothetical protein
MLAAPAIVHETLVSAMLVAALSAGAIVTTAVAQSAKDVRGASPYIEIKDEPATPTTSPSPDSPGP